MTMEGRDAHPWSPTPASIASVRCLPLLRAGRRRRPFVGCGTWERKPHQKGASDDRQQARSVVQRLMRRKNISGRREQGRGPPQAAWRGAVERPSGGPSAPGRRCWRLGRKRPSPFSNSGPTPLRSDPNLEGLKSLRCCCAKGVGHRAQLMLRARRGARENDYPVPLLRTPTPQSSLSPVLTHSRGVTTTESLELPTEMIWCGSPLSSQPSRWK